MFLAGERFPGLWQNVIFCLQKPPPPSPPHHYIIQPPLSLPQQAVLLSELEGCIVNLIKDENGNHVVQKCVEYIDSSLLDPLVNALQGQVPDLCMHPFGCRVIQRVLEHCNQTQVTSVLKEIHLQSKQLIKVLTFFFK